MKNKLDLLENLTNVLETQNVEEAEYNLNREITRIKLANESLFSQRTIQNHLNIPQHEDSDRLYSKELNTNRKNLEQKGQSIDKTGLHVSEMQTLNDISHTRKITPCYQDSTLHMTNDVNITLNQNKSGLSSVNSRNNLEKSLFKNSSTKDKLKGQNDSVPSGNQFTLNNSQLIQNKMERNEKPTRMEKTLFEEYKHPNIIEEEK